ncbi:MAG: 4Fe-4S dicluster domain-containing protein [Deltaproteobacteria bacterium]|jgi:Fe-S-cluster-containing dehydrogenase component|nr:4Fe-4S dicluster domain-containing protein [Deltaproteobacteria bacterium]
MGQQISRRSFLKGGLAAAAGLAASRIPGSEAVAEPDETKQLATLLDISKCIGCGECVAACSEANADKYPVPQKPFPKMYPSRAKVSDWSDKQDVDDRLTPYNWLFIQHASVAVNGEETELTIPRRCMHCVNPPCVKLCPWGAAKQFENGISRIDSEICLGGSKCNKVCPWDIPQRQTGVGLYLDILPNFAGNGVMYKCDRCYNRLADGDLPACIEACPEEVQTIGPRAEIIQKAHTLAKETNGHIYGETENGGTNTIYVSPVPFEEINQGIEKGKGKPDFRKAKNKMAEANNLAAAMVIAPLAGLAAAARKAYNYNKRMNRSGSNESTHQDT